MLSLKNNFKHAPLVLLGAFFLCVLSVLCVSCDDGNPVEVRENTPNEPSESGPAEGPVETVSRVKKTEPAPEPEPEPEAAEKPIRFLSYNIKNYLTMSRWVKGGERVERGKPEEEIEALIKQIVSEKPDILGICEIGTIEDLLGFQKRLKDAGLHLPHYEHAGGQDKTRHLGLLSALPITARGSEHHLPYTLEGNEMFMSRGILDVTIELPNGPTHFIGVHLKSKREIPEADQAMMRLNEAQLLRKHCDSILKKNPDARLIVYGDMNETKGEAPIKAIRGHGSSKGMLDDVWAKDSRGEFWTHYWKYQDQYARFDYVFFSRSMKPEMDFKKCYIVDPIHFYDASDHRAIMVTIGRTED